MTEKKSIYTQRIRLVVDIPDITAVIEKQLYEPLARDNINEAMFRTKQSVAGLNEIKEDVLDDDFEHKNSILYVINECLKEFASVEYYLNELKKELQNMP